MLIFPVVLLGSLAFRVASADAYRLTREKIAWITSYLQETLSGIRVVRAFGRERFHEARFAELNEENRAANMTTVYLNAAYFPVVEFVSALATVGILIFGGFQVINGHVQVGVLVGFVAALNNFFDPIQQLSQLYTTYQSGMAALDKIFELLDEVPDLEDRPDALELDRINGEILFDHVSFAYGSGEDAVLALDETSTRGAAGPDRGARRRDRRREVHLRQARSPLLRPDRGPRAGGRPRPARRHRSTRCARSSASCPRRASSSRARSRTTSPSAGRTPRARRSRRPRARWAPTSSSTSSRTATRRRSASAASQLSAGQRQLIAFARALIADPRILVLDEATSNVDVHTETRIEEGLRRLLAGRTAIVIAHRLSTIRAPAASSCSSTGGSSRQGTHDELLVAEGATGSLYRDWAEQAAA